MEKIGENTAQFEYHSTNFGGMTINIKNSLSYYKKQLVYVSWSESDVELSIWLMYFCQVYFNFE